MNSIIWFNQISKIDIEIFILQLLTLWSWYLSSSPPLSISFLPPLGISLDFYLYPSFNLHLLLIVLIYLSSFIPLLLSLTQSLSSLSLFLFLLFKLINFVYLCIFKLVNLIFKLIHLIFELIYLLFKLI
jgi:hypothetical protein